MPDASFRFGPFVVDRAAYRVLRDNVPVDLTPKLLDLLLHLLDHPGTLVTKESLLDALWPDANVTDNALTQAVSELRQALDDDAASPRYIKTVARRGYRFIAPVEKVEKIETSPPPVDAEADRVMAVLDFANLSGDSDSAWLSAGIAETVTGDLRTLGSFRVVDRWRVSEAIRRTGGAPEALAADLGAALLVTGSFQRHGSQIRITARLVDVASGDARADAKVDGEIATIFELQDRIVGELARDLGIDAASPGGGRSSARDTPSLEAYRACTEGWLRLESLDTRETASAIERFEQAVNADERYALAYTGLASAEFIVYEGTRSDNEPDQLRLERALSHARKAVALDEALAEAHATLALLLVSAWRSSEAVVSARRAVALDPSNWRHAFRLGHASWGDARLQALERTLALYPDFAFAHFQMAMVHVARGQLARAETVLRQGAAVQDRQIGRRERFPALGLHWLLGLTRLEQDDVVEALAEFDREAALARPHLLYGREYAMHARHGSGAALLRAGRFEEAAKTFQDALDLYPSHAPSHLGLRLALRGLGSHAAADAELTAIEDALRTLDRARPAEAAIVRSMGLAAAGQIDGACQVLRRLLDEAPPGFVAWTLPVEPLLRQHADQKVFAPVFAALATRAR